MLNVRPELNVLTPEQIEKVHADALKVLWETGITVDDPDAKARLEKAVGSTSEDGRVRIPRSLVQWAIDAAPNTIDVFDRTGEVAFKLDGNGMDSPVFGVGVTNLRFQDPATGDISAFSRANMSTAAGLANSLDGFDFLSTPGVIQDLPAEAADSVGLLEMIANTTKPIVMLISDWDGFVPALDLCEHLHPQLYDRPFVIPYLNPITPLVLNAETTMKMDAAIERGLPFIFSNYGMSGATCPITPAGTLVVLTAELLAGLVYSQLVKEGTPVILGSLPAAFDMKQAGSFYSPHTLLLNLACAELMSHYKIPHCGTSGSSNGWGADLLSGTTLLINHLTSGLGKVGMVPFVGGCFDSLVFSPELVVYADDVICQANTFASGFSLDDAMVGFADIDTMGPGGNYLMSTLTAQNFKSSQFSSRIWPFMSIDKWQAQGAPSAQKVLREKTCSLVENPELPQDHKEILEKGEAFLKNLGIF
ncbi:MAG: trimethylamine methyltransferase family protein [Desulfobacterales bacterium]|nr:trimethylamine methyltransferase family protein [Desulfobacterales bacterium]